MSTNELIIHPPQTNRDTLIVGSIAGLTAGLSMAFWGVLTSVYHGMDLLAAFQMMGATFMGPHATEAGFGMTLYGVVIHAATSAGLGILFTALLPQDSNTRYASGAGLGYAMVVLLAMTFVVTPIVNPVLRNTVEALPKSWVMQHILFGVTLGLVPTIRRLYNDEGVRVRIRESGPLVVRRQQLPVPPGFPAHPQKRQPGSPASVVMRVRRKVVSGPHATA